MQIINIYIRCPGEFRWIEERSQNAKEENISWIPYFYDFDSMKWLVLHHVGDWNSEKHTCWLKESEDKVQENYIIPAGNWRVKSQKEEGQRRRAPILYEFFLILWPTLELCKHKEDINMLQLSLGILPWKIRNSNSTLP